MKKPLIIKAPLPRNYLCLNLFGMFWTCHPEKIDKYVINHESIHTRQQLEMLFLPFYLFYVIEWLIKLCIYRNWNLAYRNISFEREAYRFGHDLTYLKHRKPFTWLQFLRNAK